MFFLIFIFWSLGLIFGSFATVLIERWHSGKWGIMIGRSECPHCQHILGWRDLFPLISYLWSRGKCSYCGISIPAFYPIAEILMGSIFSIIAYAGMRIGIDPISTEMVLLLLFAFTTGVYILYDMRYMEIPDQMIIPVIYLLLAIPFFSLLFTPYSGYTFHTFHIPIIDRLYGAFFLYTFFYIQIMIPGSYYLVKHRDWKHLWELILSYITFPIVMLIDIWRTPRPEEILEIPTWIGGGDLRIAIFAWLTLGVVHGIASFAFAYIIGSMIWVTILLYNAIQRKKTESQIPFWPFLGIGWILSILFYPEIIALYHILSTGQ